MRVSSLVSALFGTAFLLAQSVQAQSVHEQSVHVQGPAVYKDNVLSIPTGTIIEPDNITFYTDIELIEDSEGRFHVGQLNEGSLASVDSVELASQMSGPGTLDIEVSGYKSTPCVDVLDPAIVLEDQTFTVVLGESKSNAEVCIQVLEAYTKTVSLDVSDLQAGDYRVVVNNMAEVTFTL